MSAVSSQGPDIAPSGPVVQIRDLSFRWRADAEPTLQVPALRIEAGESVFLRGASGSGKTTLLNLIAGVLVPEAGSVQLLGETLSSLASARRDRLRADHVGFVFQQFNLLPYLGVVDNVLLPCRFSRLRARRAGDPAAEAVRLLDALGLDGAVRRARDVTELSVGQQQRVALARGLIGRPQLVIADEPTSALDADARDEFLALLESECAAAGAALLFVSHDGGLAGRFSRQLDMRELNAGAGSTDGASPPAAARRAGSA
ncbi:MAG TPA: ABC transporter ATP-binding protein [Pseudomonadales bacterium]|nr:ABC transporter ATP-binding protein [Pseudomonadales bacterium]